MHLIVSSSFLFSTHHNIIPSIFSFLPAHQIQIHSQKFGTAIVARDLKISGGYKPGSNVSRNLIAYSNLYWAKKLAGSVKGGALGGNPVGVLTAEQVNFDEVGNFGDVSRSGVIFQEKARKG